MENGKNGSGLRALVQSSMLLALAVAVRNLSFMVYFGGAPGMRISFSGIFTKLAAILFGPVYGAGCSALLDVIGYLLKPEGAYIPWLTATAALGGAMTGLVWRLLSGAGSGKLRAAVPVFFSAVALVGLFNHLSVAVFPDSPWAGVLEGIGSKRDIAIYGLEAAGIMGLALSAATSLAERRRQAGGSRGAAAAVMVSTGLPGLVVNTMNTWLLRIFIPSLGSLGFWALWAPRFAGELVMSVIQAYVVYLLLSVYKKVSGGSGNGPG